MNILTEAEFNDITKGIKYWNNRWRYIGVVADIVRKMSFKNSVEVGTNGVKIISTSLEIKDEKVFDLNLSNWCFKTDLFIALQVFEHLESQVNAFKELSKAAKTAIISLPYKWDCPKDLQHHMITDEIINNWAGREPNESIYVSSRIINIYNF